MRKTSGLSFAVWVNWIFFSLYIIFSGFAAWAIFNQKDTALIAKIEALTILLLVLVLPAIIFMINAILFRKISRENSTSDRSETFSGLK